MTHIIRFKPGDTFELSGQLLTDQTSNTPVNISGYTIRSQVRRQGQLIQNLTTSIVDAANGRYQASATPAQTTTWPVGPCIMDIEFTTNVGKVMSSETINLACVEDVTI